jgi:zinc and cadmium transporter
VSATLALYSMIIFLSAIVGGMLPIFWSEQKAHHLSWFVSLGAGLLLGMAFLHMIPHAAEFLPHSFGIWVLFGFVILLMLERFVMVHACEEHGCHYHTVGLAAFAGMAVHGVIEGFALGSSQMTTPLGPLVLVAILTHKAPSAFALTSILKLAGKSKSQILGFVAGVGLSVPLGIGLAYFLVQSQFVHSPAGILLSISAGTFIYISACDLLPEIHRSDSDKIPRLAAFALGIILSFVSGYIVEGH